MNPQTAEIIVKNPTEGLRIASVGNVYRMIVTGEETAGRFSLMETFVKPGKGGPYHIHSREEEGFLITEGEMVFYTGTQRVVAERGTFVSCPPGAMRGFRNESDQLAKMLIFYTPPGIEKMIELDGVVVGSDIETLSDEKLTRDACPQLATEYGITDITDPLPDLTS